MKKEQLLKALNQKKLQWLLFSLMLLIGFISLKLLWNVTSTTNVGGGDFTGYWSATYLFHNGQNPYDPNLLEFTQHVQMQSGLDYTIMAWNPPTLFVFLLPLAWLPFTTAKFVMLLMNLIIVLGTSLMLSRLYLPTNNMRLILIYLMLAISMPQVISGLFMGQVTFFVLLGLVSSMALIKKGQWFWAGAVLVFTSIKPHMAILAVIYLLILMAQHRQYKGWLGLIVAGIVCVIVLFVFRFSWINDLLGETAIAPVNWATPTIGGLLSYHHITEYGRYLIILLLPLPFLLSRYQTTISMEFSVALLTLITVPFTFFGWSYDQTILLIPIAQIFGLTSRLNNKTFNFWLALTVIIALVSNYWQRLFNTNDVYYFWVPLFWCLIFGLAWYLYSIKSKSHDPIPS
jgi:hypothetical protein